MATIGLLGIEHMYKYVSPVNPAVYPHLTLVLMGIGLFFMAWFFVYESPQCSWASASSFFSGSAYTSSNVATHDAVGGAASSGSCWNEWMALVAHRVLQKASHRSSSSFFFSFFELLYIPGELK
ncbi:hypothetical protein MTO96_008355 [Rhipicephalus appendiculatus]